MGYRILIIEDNPDNLELMAYLIRAFGHTALTAEDGVAGMEAARQERPDLIIIDIQLPKMDGYQVARALKSEPALRWIPRVAVTALAMVGDREKVLASGFDGYIPKPIAPETFVGQVEEFLPGHPAPSPLPVIERPAEPAAPVVRAKANGKLILVVDNSPVNIQLARSILEPVGYQVAAAWGARGALESARQAPPDLILSDVHMPEGTGFELLEAVRADSALRNVPFIFVSATLPSHALRDAAQKAGAGFLSRPIDPQVMVSEIESALNMRAPEA